MSLLDVLDEVIEDAVASQIVVLNKYRKDDNTIFCLVEGIEDIGFYRNYIERHTSQKIEFINCSGKDNVIENYDVLDWGFYDKKRVLFFIDKDFDDFISNSTPNDSNIFVTEHYSIENYLVTTDVLEKFLIDNCSLINSSDRKKILDHFIVEHDRFISYFKKISAWMMFCRNNKHKVCFDDIKLDKLFKIDKTSGKLVRVKNTSTTHFNLISSQVKDTFYDFTEIKYFRGLLHTRIHKKFIRGKFEAFFMFIYVKYVVDNVIPHIASKITQYNKQQGVKKKLKPKVVIQVKEENLFQILSNKVYEPIALRDFLHSNLN